MISNDLVEKANDAVYTDWFFKNCVKDAEPQSFNHNYSNLSMTTGTINCWFQKLNGDQGFNSLSSRVNPNEQIAIELQMPEQQQNNIQKLDKDVAVVLRSHVVISSLADALREVIQNSNYEFLSFHSIGN